MYRLRPLLVLVLGAIVLGTGCSPAVNVAAGLAAPAATVASPPTSTSTTAPPDPCADYDALERGEGEAHRQAWMNGLDARGYARFRMACVYRWGTAEWECLDQLWREESSWDHRLRDGIPQAQPNRKMAAAGPDWRTNPRTQVRWGLAYIADRYGAPTRASLRNRPCHAGY